MCALYQLVQHSAAVFAKVQIISGKKKRQGINSQSRGRFQVAWGLTMQFARDFWVALHNLAAHIEHTPGTPDRRRQRIAAYAAFGPLGQQTALAQVRLALTELAEIERQIAADGDGQTPGRERVAITDQERE
jgi:hypothetical protein